MRAEQKSPAGAGLPIYWYLLERLKFLVEVARRAGDIDSSRYAALAVFHSLDDARRFAAFRAVGGLRRVHCFLAITSFGNFGHGLGVSPLKIVSAHTRRSITRGFNGAVAQPSTDQLQSIGTTPAAFCLREAGGLAAS
jgi:hypothetical protein